MTARIFALSVAGTLGTKLLPGVLSIVAGSVDVISFLGLGGLFAAHITGNLVVLAAHLVTGRVASLAAILSVPVFIVVLGLTRLAAAALEGERHCPLKPLLALQSRILARTVVWVRKKDAGGVLTTRWSCSFGSPKNRLDSQPWLNAATVTEHSQWHTSEPIADCNQRLASEMGPA